MKKIFLVLGIAIFALGISVCHFVFAADEKQITPTIIEFSCVAKDTDSTFLTNIVCSGTTKDSNSVNMTAFGQVIGIRVASDGSFLKSYFSIDVEDGAQKIILEPVYVREAGRAIAGTAIKGRPVEIAVNIKSVVFDPKSEYDRGYSGGYYDFHRILITFDKNKIDLMTEAGRKAADEFIAKQKYWVKEDYINFQNLAIVYLYNTKAKMSDSELMMKPQIAVGKVAASGLGTAQYNIIYEFAFKPNDPEYKKQTSFFNQFTINGKTVGSQIEEAWNVTEKKVYEKSGSSNVKLTKEILIALLDQGLRDADYKDKDFENVIWAPQGGNCFDFNGNSIKCSWGGIFIQKYLVNKSNVSAYSDPRGFNRHGISMARIIASRIENNKGFAGINNISSAGRDALAKLMLVKLGFSPRKSYDQYFDDDYLSSAQIIAGIHFARLNGAHLINLSVAKTNKGSQYDDLAVREAVRIAGNSGIFTITPDSGLCSTKLSPINSQYAKNKEVFNPLVCVTPYRIGSKLANSYALKYDDFIDVDQMPADIGNGLAPPPEKPDIAANASNYFLAQNELTEAPSMSNSQAAAMTTGAMAHLLRFGLVNVDQKNLLRCITINASDDIMSVGYKSGKLYKLLNLNKMVNFSGDLQKCQDMAAQREAGVAVKVNIGSITAEKIGEKYQLSTSFEVPKDVGNFEYITNYHNKTLIYHINDKNYFKIGYSSEERNSFLVRFNLLDQRDFASDEHCITIYARKNNSLLVGSATKCIVGSEALSGAAALFFDAQTDSSEIFEQKSEGTSQINISLSSPSMSVVSGNLEVKVRRIYDINKVPDTITAEAKRELANAFYSFNKKYEFKNIKIKNGKWSASLNLQTSPVDTIEVFAVFKPLQGKVQEFSKLVNFDGDYYDINPFGGMYGFYARGIPGKEDEFYLDFEAKIPYYRGQTKSAFLEFSPRFGKMDFASVNSSHGTLEKINKKGGVIFKITPNVDSSGRPQVIDFSVLIKMPKEEQEKAFNNLLIGQYDDAKFYFFNAAGIPIEYPIFYILTEEDLKDDMEKGENAPPASIRPDTTKLLSGGKLATTQNISSNTLCSGAQTTSDKKCFQGIWVEKVSGGNCGQYIARDILSMKSQASSFFSFSSFEDAEGKIATMVNIGLITAKECPPECPDNGQPTDR